MQWLWREEREKEEARMEVGLGGRSLYNPDAKQDAAGVGDDGV